MLSVFKIKKNFTGEVTRHKSRLVAKGYSQRYGIDYEECSLLLLDLNLFEC